MPPTSSDVELSVVIPFFNEGPNIEHLFERLHQVLRQIGARYEIICVDDGSRDDTLAGLIRQHERDSSVKVISLSRNFGKEVALTAGLDYSSGAAVVPLDADLQDPPELIGELLAKWREGYDVVYATRRFRQGETATKRLTANAFYKVISGISSIDIPRNTGDFRLLDRRVVDAIKCMPERTRFMKGLFAWVGFKQASILYDRPQRYKGQTKWNYWKLWNFALDGITSFSLIPLKVWSYVGFTFSIASFIYAAYLVIRTLLLGVDVPGYASLMVVMLFLGGLQLITLGIIGEYMGRIFEEVKRRPLYLVRELHGYDLVQPTGRRMPSSIDYYSHD